MARPRAMHTGVKLSDRTRYLIIDGYVDEHASLGVPPYLSPQVRSLAGGLVTGGADRTEIGYLTVDQWRTSRGVGGSLSCPEKLESVILVSGCVVPGKYLRGTPISPRETLELMSGIDVPLKVITGSSAPSNPPDGTRVHKGDAGVLGSSIASGSRIETRARTAEEWDIHLISGAFIAGEHPDHPTPLICEIETSRGCPRYITGGCSFCMEPRRGKVEFRQPEGIFQEIENLAEHGVENIRIGGQSDLLTYLSTDIGRSEVPCPDPDILNYLMTGVRKALHGGRGVKKAISGGARPEIDTGIIHTDNANPAVISDHPEEAELALNAIMRGATGGSVLALGLESSDSEVKDLNNLNSTPEQVLDAVRTMNRTGRNYSSNGLPHLLPGLNFLGGLPGQTPGSFEKDMELLESILDEGLLLRRINIRRVLMGDGRTSWQELRDPDLETSFRNFRDRVRSRIDTQFLSRMCPAGHVLRGIHTETVNGHVVFGRQIGSYPILVGIPHRVPIDAKVDVAVTETSSRSLTGFRTPFDMSGASFRDLTALPGVGKKRAATLFRSLNGSGLPDTDVFKGNEWVLDHLKME